MKYKKTLGLVAVGSGLAYVAKRYGALIKLGNLGHKVVAPVGTATQHVQDNAEHVTKKMSDTKDVAERTAQDMAGRMRESASSLPDQAKGTASRVVEEARPRTLRDRLRRKQP